MSNISISSLLTLYLITINVLTFRLYGIGKWKVRGIVTGVNWRKMSLKKSFSRGIPAVRYYFTGSVRRNLHSTSEVWARTRIEQGWTYGPTRNDQLKQHPCLVPYDELPESEKEYDRCTSVETLKTLSALGWKLVKTEE